MGGLPKEGLQFVAWVHMAFTTHTGERAEFHYVYCSQPWKGWGNRVVGACPVVLVAALSFFHAICAVLQTRGNAVEWRDTMGATIYNHAGRTSHCLLAQDKDVAVHSEKTASDVAITWSG